MHIGDFLDNSQGKNFDYIPKSIVLFNILFSSATIFCLCTDRIFSLAVFLLIILALDIPKSNHTGVNQKLNKFTGILITTCLPLNCKTCQTL